MHKSDLSLANNVSDGLMRSAAWIRSADKTDVNTGSWKSGRMPKTIVRTKAPYVLSGSWSWRVVTFKFEGDDYTLLIAHRAERTDFMAMLVHVGQEATILCRLEHHGSHPGWHVHYQAQRPFVSGVTTFPHWRKRYCGGDSAFKADVVSGFEPWAMTLANRLFCFQPHDDELL